MQDDTIFDLSNLFNNPNYLYEKDNQLNSSSLNELLESNFLTNLIPLSHILDEGENKIDENITSLSKFKELNLNKVKEDMLYYCTPVEILSKLDKNKGEYIYKDSDLEFYNDLSIKTFLQRQNELKDIFYNDEVKIENIEKSKNFNEWKYSFKDVENQSYYSKDKDKLDEINNILKNIQKVIKIFLIEKDIDNLSNSLNEIISDLQKEKIEIKDLGYELYILLENNLIFLLGLIEKKFSKDEEIMGKFIGAFIDMINYIKSNRLFFKIIQLHTKYKNIPKQLNIYKNVKMISDESIDLKKIIKDMNINKKINIKDLKNFNLSKGYETKEKNCIADDELWIVNNKEELFIFSNSPDPKDLYFYKINLREEEYAIEDTYEMIDFGKIILSNREDDLIFNINISIKNDLIYICYLVNQKLNTNDSAPLKFEFNLFYKIYSTSMNLLKEDLIKLNDFDCLNSYLYSDQKYIYVISENNKIFILKKNYSMNDYKYSKFRLDPNAEYISISDYKFHNCFNLNNFILLENKKDMEDLLLAQFSIKNNEYILNIINMNTLKKWICQQENVKYKISYNDNMFLVVKIEQNSIYLSLPDFNINNFIGKGIQFLPFDDNYNIFINDDNSNNNSIYNSLLKEYSIFVNLYGNFDIVENKSDKILLTNPYYFCFNININNLNFIIEQILSKELNIQTKIYYINIIKQYICCLYNTDCLNIEQINKLIEFMKQYILDINIDYKDNKKRKYIHKVLNEITYISSYLGSKNIVEIQDIKNIINKNNELIYKTKFLLLDLLFTQTNTQQNTELFNLILEVDKNFLLDILDDKKDEDFKMYLLSSNYKIYKSIMNKAISLMENYYKNQSKNSKEINLKLFSLTTKITKNIEQICKLYPKCFDTKLNSLPIFFYSINFSMLYLILQRLIINDTFNKDMKIISSLYNLLLIFDKLNINKNIEKSFDLDNIIEIKNSTIEYEGNEKNEKITNIINFNSTKNIIFKNNLTNVLDYNDFMNIKLIRKDKNESQQLDLNEVYDYIHYNVDGIEVTFNNYKSNKQFILNVISIKDEKLYLKNRNNENYRIINLLQKTILHYFLFLFENIDEKIKNYIKEKEVKNFSKLYLTQFFQYINTNNIDINLSLFDKNNKNDKKGEKNEDSNENKEENIIFKSDKLIKDIYEIFDYPKKDIEILTNKNNKSPIHLLSEQFILLFGKINNETNNFYKKDELFLQKLLSYKDINLSDSSFSKLIEQFNSDISKKNKLLNSIKSNDLINKMILKLFQIIIKYYNYNNKLFSLMENINNLSKNENYKLFCNIYEECCQMKMVYNQQKSRFVDEKFEEQSQNYINITNAKLDFIYRIIIPSVDDSLKYDKSIVQNLIDLIKNQNFSPKEIIKYAEIQNINCTIKILELLIINNLLFNLNEEDNLKFILYVINNKYNKNPKANNYSISISLFDSIYGADFSQMEQIKSQFHLLIEIIIDKYILNNNNYDKLSITTKIALFQSLLWKYKGRDFNILPKIIKCFDDMKNYELIENNNENIIFKLNQEKIYRINNYNLDTFRNIKFEIFKIITSQIFMKIKDNLNNGIIKQNDNSLNITRNISNIKDYKNIIYLLISYFSFVKKNNKYYKEIVLFFYKNIINSNNLINLIIDSYPEVIIKIFDIIFNSDNNNQNINTKLIVLKLFLQILENINNEDKNACLIDCCMQYNNNEINNEKNEEFYPFEFLLTKFNNLLKKEEENEFLKYYYFKIFLFCLNKIDLKKSNIDKKNLLNINLLLSSNNHLSQIESTFNIKNDYGNEFEENALFCNLESNKVPKSGNLLCFFDRESLFNNYVTENNITYFNYNDFDYNVEQKKNTENIFVIMDESLDGKINKINTIEKRNIKDITLIDNKKNNFFYANYLENNSTYIYDNLIMKLFEHKLSYRGINYILKFIYNLLNYIKNENAEKIIKYIFEYINDENVIKNKNEWDFCSLEYFINEMNSFQNIFDYSSFNILNENKKEKNENEKKNEKSMEGPLLLSSLFNYIIKGKDLSIEYKSNNKIKKTLVNKLNKLNKPINEINSDNNNILIKMTDLSFYKSHPINSIFKINDNSLLLIKTLTPNQELIDILNTNKSKIKSIIISEKDENINENEFDKFLSNISIPIYLVKNEFYKQIIEFFIEGKGGEYIPSTENNKILESEIILIYKPLYYLNKKKISKGLEEKDNINLIQESFYTSDDLDLDILFGQTSNSIVNLNDKQKKEKLNEFQKNIDKKYSEINFDLEKVYCLENIKLCYRILYELLSKPNITNQINKEYLNKNIDTIIEIFDSLCQEYYFNISKKYPVNNLQNLLKKYLKSLNKENKFIQKWIQFLMKHFIKNKNINEELVCKEYDKLLYIFKECNDLLIDEYSINIFYDIINDIIEKSISNIDKNTNKENKLREVPIINVNNYIIKKNNNKIFKNEFISYFLYEITNGIYETIINNKCNSKLLIKCFIKNNYISSIIKFIDEIIEVKKYLSNDNSEIPKDKTLLVQFGLKYLDICFYIFLKEKQYDLIDYWFKSNNDLFLFYSAYKILSTEKHYEEIDYKELLSIIAYISNSIECFNEYLINNKKNEKDNKIFKMKMNTFNKLNLKNNDDNDSNYNKLSSFSFNDVNKNNINYNKLAIFIYNKQTKTYSLQDIIDTSISSDLKQNLGNYKQLFNVEEIYLVPLNNIITSLYAFGNNFNHSLGINGKLAKYYDKPTKCEGLPNNIWNIGYGNNYCLALSEKDNQIYACGCNKGGGFNSTPRASFTNETRINNFEENSQKNNYLNFATGNCDSSLLINEKGELYGIGNNEMKIFGLNDKKLKYPTKLNLEIYDKKNNNPNNNKDENKVNEKRIGKIKSFYIGYYNCYIINEEGKLFGIGNNSSFQISDEEIEIYYKWKNIPLPQNCTKFVDCAVGEKYLICLVEDRNGNNKLYAQGNNDNNQCGINTEPRGEPIKQLAMCENTINLSFKKIYTRNSQSAAITIEGDLYIWGQTAFNNNKEIFNIPTLVLLDTNNDLKNNKNNLNFEEDRINDNKINIINEELSYKNNKTIVDEVAICRSHMLFIARKYENGEYIRKLFGYGDNSKGALGLPMTNNKSDMINTIEEIPLFNDKNEKLIPMKLTIGDNKSYILCVNEKELLKEINNSKIKDNQDCCINITNLYIEKIGKNLIDFYNSKNLSKFINLFRTITNKVLSEFIEAIDEIKISLQENNEPRKIIDFPNFFDYIRKHEASSEIHRIFVQSESSDKDINEKQELKSIFNYLKTKSKFITEEIFRYCSTNEKSEYKSFLQKAIGNNISYLSAERRLQKFNELLSKRIQKRGTEKRVEVDRFKANAFYDKFNEDPKNQVSDLEFNKTIFGQVYQTFGKTNGEDFFIQKGRRLFIVCLKNEYASDSGGPYHEVISGICSELQSDYLNLFIKTPNNKHDIGLLRDKYIPNPQATREINEKTFEFLGKIMASSVSSGEALDLNLHPVVWKALLGNEISFYEYESIDYTYFSLINNLEKELKIYEENKNINENFEDLYQLNFVIKNSNENDIVLKPDGEKIHVNFDNLKEYISLSKKMRTNEFITQIEYIKNGFNSVIPSSIFQVLNWRQLEEMVCGKNKLDIRDLKKHTKYEGFKENDEIIKWFWEWLGECNDHEQSLYLKFVSGRARLPKETDFKYEHIIVKNDYNNNEALPHSATCFFTLKLPMYKDKETLKKKLEYSILNCDEIDGDH